MNWRGVESWGADGRGAHRSRVVRHGEGHGRCRRETTGRARSVAVRFGAVWQALTGQIRRVDHRHESGKAGKLIEEQMNRRNFFKGIAALPLAVVAPKALPAQPWRGGDLVARNGMLYLHRGEPRMHINFVLNRKSH